MYLLFELTIIVHQAQRAMTVDGAAGTSAADAVTRSRAVVIVSGLSGGGKTAAAKLFEDLGYTVVDNLPGELLPDLAELVSADRERFAQVAIVLDVRSGDAPLALAAMRERARGPRDPASRRLPRGARRRPDPAVQRDPPPAPARRRARDRQLDRRGAPAASTRSGPSRTSSRHLGPVAARSCASGSSRRSRRRSEPTSSRSS